MTRQRQVILEELRKVSSHPTADEVYERVRRRLPRISLGTVYRNLEILSACGLASKLELGCPQMRFDGNPHNHYHVRCTCCSRVDDVGTELVEALEDVLGVASDYEIVSHQLQFIGLCPDCRSGKPAHGGQSDKPMEEGN